MEGQSLIWVVAGRLFGWYGLGSVLCVLGVLAEQEVEECCGGFGSEGWGLVGEVDGGLARGCARRLGRGGGPVATRGTRSGHITSGEISTECTRGGGWALRRSCGCCREGWTRSTPLWPRDFRRDVGSRLSVRESPQVIGYTSQYRTASARAGIHRLGSRLVQVRIPAYGPGERCRSRGEVAVTDSHMPGHSRVSGSGAARNWHASGTGLRQ